MTAYVSASRVGAMLGADPRKSPLALFHELRGELPEQEDAEPLREGRYFEDAIAAIARDKFKLVVGSPDKGLIEMRDGPLVGHIDRTFIEDGLFGVLEIKQTFLGGGGQEWGESGSDIVPRHYFLQSLTYQGLLRACSRRNDLANYGLVAARVTGGVQRFPIGWDAELYARIKAEAESFLVRVRENLPPDPKDEADMRRRWLVVDTKSVVGTPEVLAHIETLRELRKNIGAGEKARRDLSKMILGFAQDAGAITDESGQVRAHLTCDRAFDETAFVAAHPDVAARYQRLDSSRLSKEQRTLYESFMRKPERAVDQKRVIHIVEPKS